MAQSRWLTWAGGLITLAGVVILAWLQAEVSGDGLVPDSKMAYRLQVATAPLIVVALGVLVIGAGLILSTLQCRAQPAD